MLHRTFGAAGTKPLFECLGQRFQSCRAMHGLRDVQALTDVSNLQKNSLFNKARSEVLVSKGTCREGAGLNAEVCVVDHGGHSPHTPNVKAIQYIKNS